MRKQKIPFGIILISILLVLLAFVVPFFAIKYAINSSLSIFLLIILSLFAFLFFLFLGIFTFRGNRWMGIIVPHFFAIFAGVSILQTFTYGFYWLRILGIIISVLIIFYFLVDKKSKKFFS